MTFDFNAMRSMSTPQDMLKHLEGMKAQAEEQIARMREARDAIAAISATGTDANSLVEVTIGSGGELRELVIAPYVTQQQYLVLGHAIIAALQVAREELQEKLNEVRPRR